ncbi:MAG: hypothetical protein ACRDO4_07910 [Nocardioides sp.]
MPTDLAEPSRPAHRARLLALVLPLVLPLVLIATACTSSSPDPPGAERDAGPVAASERDVKRLLARRERAIEKGRRTLFAATVGRRDRDGQLAWFEVLTRLPVADIEHDVAGVRLMPGTDVTEVSLQMTVRLRGFDRRPVAASHVLELTRADQGWRVARDRFALSQMMSAPWMMADARVRVTDDVILLLDGRSEEQADRLVRLASEALVATRGQVPFGWHDQVVVLAPSSVTPLRNEGYQVEQIKLLGGIATEVDNLAGKPVGRRVLLAPQMLDETDDAVRTLLRHEFAHVAIGERDRALPLWVSEGMAEWSSWDGQDSFRIATSAVEAAERGIEKMPEDAEFRGTDPARAYGIAWFALRWLEDEHGDGTPWQVLELAQRHRRSGERAFSKALDKRWGVSIDELAKRAGTLIDETFE